MAYDPQKTRNRPAPAADRPAPVDAFLDAVPAANDPDLVAVSDAVLGEELVIDAPVEVTVEPATRTPFDPAEWEGDAPAATRGAGRSRLLLAGGAAAVVAIVAVVAWSRRRR